VGLKGQGDERGFAVDKLDHIFELQARFDEALAEKRDLHFSQEEWVQKEVLAMISELAELLDEVNFKWWKNPKPINIESAGEELVDIMHFLVSTCIKLGIDSEAFYQAYLGKNAENFARQEGGSRKPGYDYRKNNQDRARRI